MSSRYEVDLIYLPVSLFTTAIFFQSMQIKNSFWKLYLKYTGLDWSSDLFSTTYYAVD